MVPRKPKPVKANNGKKIVNKNFTNFQNNDNIKRCSRYTYKGALFAERFIGSVIYLLEKTGVEKKLNRKLSYLPIHRKMYDNETVNFLIIFRPTKASLKKEKKNVIDNLGDKSAKSSR